MHNEELSQLSVSLDEQDKKTSHTDLKSNSFERNSVEDYGDIEAAPGKKNIYRDTDEDEDEDALPRKVDNLYTDLSCWCLPTCASHPREFCSRSGMWFLANSDQFLSSIIVAISMIPESISYALIAGLPPSSALQSCWIVNMITAAVGGRPGMISSASGLVALLLHRLVQSKEGGIMYVFYSVVFAGVLQCVAALVGLGKLASTFPAPVVVGMVNAMALLMLAMQFRFAKEFPLDDSEVNELSLEGEDKAVEITWNISALAYFGSGFEWISPWLNLGIYGAEVAVAFLVSMLLPKFTSFFPATLVSILVVVAIEFGISRQFGVETPLIGDYGGSQVENPIETIFSGRYTLPDLSDFESWKIILGYGSALFATTFTETAIALNVVDRLDETQGPGFLVLIGQGIANIVSGLLGGMGGSGVVSLSVLADRTFGTTCLSTFTTGGVMFLIVTWGYPIVDFIPLSAISGISISMICSFIQWRSMIAIFTMCLPTSKRESLPPQYNVARYDVLIMFIVTAGLLLVDVSTLAFFVMGLAVFIFSFLQRRCSKNKKDEEIDIHALGEHRLEDEEEQPKKKKFFEWRGKKKNQAKEKEEEEMAAAAAEEARKQQEEEQLRRASIKSQNQQGVIEVGDDKSVRQECEVTDGLCGIMESAERQLFPDYDANPSTVATSRY